MSTRVVPFPFACTPYSANEAILCVCSFEEQRHFPGCVSILRTTDLFSPCSSWVKGLASETKLRLGEVPLFQYTPGGFLQSL